MYVTGDIARYAPSNDIVEYLQRTEADQDASASGTFTMYDSSLTLRNPRAR
jgi:hypothetical protein